MHKSPMCRGSLVSRKYCNEQARDLTDIAAACGQLRLQWSDREERHRRQSDDGRSERAWEANEFQTKLTSTSANSALIARHGGGGLDLERLLANVTFPKGSIRPFGLTHLCTPQRSLSGGGSLASRRRHSPW